MSKETHTAKQRELLITAHKANGKCFHLRGVVEGNAIQFSLQIDQKRFPNQAGNQPEGLAYKRALFGLMKDGLVTMDTIEDGLYEWRLTKKGDLRAMALIVKA